MPTNLYQAIIMEHYRFPLNRGTLIYPDATTGSTNPSCGDSVAFEMYIQNGIITGIAFQGAGCVLSQAAASMLSEKVKTMSIPQVHKLGAKDILKIIGIELGPTRLRCALLPLEALQKIKHDA